MAGSEASPPPERDRSDGAGERASAFPATHWSLVARMQDHNEAGRREALEELCRTYWYPAYAFVRRKGNKPQDAEDLTQGFFLRFIEGDRFAGADPDRGRFRTYLLASLSNYLNDQWDRSRAQKRGGGRVPVSIEASLAEARYNREPRTEESPDELFDRRWALTILEAGFPSPARGIRVRRQGPHLRNPPPDPRPRRTAVELPRTGRPPRDDRESRPRHRPPVSQTSPRSPPRRDRQDRRRSHRGRGRGRLLLPHPLKVMIVRP